MHRVLSFGLALTIVGACENDPPSSTEPDPTATAPATPSTAVTPPPLPEPAADDRLGRIIFELANQYATGLEADRRVDGPALGPGQFHDVPLILSGGRCYKMLGAAESSVTDFDLILYDPDQVQLAQDSSSDNRPILGITSPICLREAGQFRLQARLISGRGAFAVQVMRSQIW